MCRMRYGGRANKIPVVCATSALPPWKPRVIPAPCFSTDPQPILHTPRNPQPPLHSASLFCRGTAEKSIPDLSCAKVHNPISLPAPTPIFPPHLTPLPPGGLDALLGKSCRHSNHLDTRGLFKDTRSNRL